jgi:hypothetical protein
MKESFSTFEVCKIVGVKYQRLRTWIDSGFIQPSIRRAEGIGDRTAFSAHDLLVLVIFVELLAEKFSRETANSRAKGAADYIRYAQGNDLDKCDYLLFDKDDPIQTEKGRWQRPPVVILNEQWFREKSLFEILGSGGHYTAPESFSKLTIVNFKKIRDRIKIAME